QIKIEDSKLTIFARKAPIIIRIFLVLIITVLALIPFAIVYFVFSDGNGLHIGIAFSFMLCWGIGFYVLRLFLWNSYGREILILNKNNIIYLADYRLYKDGKRKIGTKNLEIEIINENDPKLSLGRLRLKNKSSSIETNL